jgi:hypothetical protein
VTHHRVNHPFGSPSQKRRIAEGRLTRERLADILFRWAWRRQ